MRSLRSVGSSCELSFLFTCFLLWRLSFPVEGIPDTSSDYSIAAAWTSPTSLITFPFFLRLACSQSSGWWLCMPCDTCVHMCVCVRAITPTFLCLGSEEWKPCYFLCRDSLTDLWALLFFNRWSIAAVYLITTALPNNIKQSQFLQRCWCVFSGFTCAWNSSSRLFIHLIYLWSVWLMERSSRRPRKKINYALLAKGGGKGLFWKTWTS